QEDFLGDMDFKVTMTPAGITAMQLDVKIKGLSFEVFKKAFGQARTGINHIIDEMLKIQPKVADSLSPYAPLIMNVPIPVEKIRAVIGKGGENVQRMEKDYNVKISIAEDGNTTITAKDQIGGQKAVEEIKAMVWQPEVGYKGTGKIVKIIDGTGAIVEFRGKSGMIHISKLAPTRVANVTDIVKEGEEVEFEVIEVNLEKGRIGLKKKFDPLPSKPVETQKVETNNEEKKEA
ncbi:MAG: S1 RNA-binding domain-containing protein, partial [Candidatus Gracilibacteria bacterium]|nr:S1 RNA-binding domain-containing protein [Candidatus Gracilibacteria bacterium]